MSHFVIKDFMKRKAIIINPDILGDESTVKIIKFASLPILVDRKSKVSIGVTKI